MALLYVSVRNFLAYFVLVWFFFFYLVSWPCERCHYFFLFFACFNSSSVVSCLPSLRRCLFIIIFAFSRIKSID